jgi:hypothetical protein
VPVTPVQRLLANPLAATLARILADPAHGPATLEQWIQTEADLVAQIDPAALTAAVQHHPLVGRWGRRLVVQALRTWDVDGYALLLDLVVGMAPAIAQETRPPAQQAAVVAGLQAMARRIGQDPAAFTWFCRQMRTLQTRILAVLDPPPAPHDNPSRPA